MVDLRWEAYTNLITASESAIRGSREESDNGFQLVLFHGHDAPYPPPTASPQGATLSPPLTQPFLSPVPDSPTLSIVFFSFVTKGLMATRVELRH